MTKTILYIEDDQDNRLLVRRTLEAAGYQVIEAFDGLSGIKMAQEHQPDLILMDIYIPSMDGYEVTTRLKSLPKLSHIPIIALTAKVIAGARELALTAGCDGYIVKPIDVDLFPRQIADFLGGMRESISVEQENLYLRQYNERLVDRLETKVQELTNIFNMVQNIDEPQRQAELTRKSVKQKFNPYIAGPPIDDPDLFFGREELLATIIRNLPNNHIALEGPRRSGKSSLLKQLARRLCDLNDPDYYFVPVLFDCHETTERDFFYDLMGTLLGTLGEVDPGLSLPSLVYQPAAYAVASNYDNRAFKNDLKFILAALAATRPQQIRIILLLDEGDALNEYEQTTQRKIRNLISQNPALKMVWAGTRVLTAAGDPTSPWYNMQVTDTLPRLSEAEARRLITQPVAKLGYIYDEAALNRILEWAKGQPYIIQYLCLHAVNAMLNKERSVITLADVESALGKLEQEKSADDPGSVLYQPRQQPETTLSIAEKPAPYHTEDEQP